VLTRDMPIAARPQQALREGEGQAAVPLSFTLRHVRRPRGGLLPRCSEGLWHALDRVLAVRDVHDRHTGNLAYSALEVAIAGGDDVAS
jgi:hypothetical protein